MLRLFWAALAGAAAGAVILAGLYLPGAPTEPVFMVPFFIAFACFASVLYQINGAWYGRIPSSQLWELLRELPVWARAVLAVLFVATTAQVVLSQTEAPSELGFMRTFASIAVWICVGAAALAFAQWRKLGRATPLPAMSGKRKALLTVLSAAVGLAAFASFLLAQRVR